MSKSLGNGIDPLEVIDQYGADALRFTLITGNAPGNDMRFYEERVLNSRNFANKVWNASRFIMMNLEGFDGKKPAQESLEIEDRWILSAVNTLAMEVTENMDKFELGIAVSKVYDFIWDEFCDWYIEIVKPRIWNKDQNEISRHAALWTLQTVLADALKLLHPYMPFITEEIYCSLLPEEESIMISDWPLYQQEYVFKEEEEAIARAKNLVRGIRDLRTDMDVPPSRKAKVIITSANDKVREIYSNMISVYRELANASEITISEDKSMVPEDAVSVVIPDAVIYMPLEDLVDFSKEKERLMKEQERLSKELNRSKGMLANEKFLAKAPEEKVEEEKAKLEKYQQMMNDVTLRLSQMK